MALPHVVGYDTCTHTHLIDLLLYQLPMHPAVYLVHLAVTNTDTLAHIHRSIRQTQNTVLYRAAPNIFQRYFRCRSNN